MANNVVLKMIELTDQFQPLSAVPLVASITLSAPPANSGAVTLRTPAGAEAEMIPGEWHTLYRVNLARLEVRGSAGDMLSMVGGTW